MKSLWWGAMPWERDGGAVVNYYLLKMLNYLEPTHQFFGIPKVPEELEAGALPFVQFFPVKYNGVKIEDNKHLIKLIPQFMLQKEIPLLVMFHMPWEFFPIIYHLKNCGLKTLIHQTIHWQTDVLFQSKVLNDVDMWVAPTRWGEEQLSLIGKIARNKITYIPHAVDVEKFYPHNTSFRESFKLSPDQKVILVTGRCTLFKGIHQVIPIMRPLIKDYNTVFIIRAGHERGMPSEGLDYIFQVLSHQFPKNIIYLRDWLPPETNEELMASCDILLQPSGHEGFDMPLAEAMACKKAIAVNNIPNHWEILGKRNRYCGIFMEPSEVAGLVNGETEVKVPSSDLIEGTLRFLLDNPEECKVMGENGYARARRHYNLARIADKWLELMFDMSEGEKNDS